MIIATTPVSIPASTYSTIWIQRVNISNVNPAKPTATVVFAYGDANGNIAPGSKPIIYNVDIAAKIGAGDPDLAGIMATVTTKAASLAIADGVIAATVTA